MSTPFAMTTAIFGSLFTEPAMFERLTGWSVKPEGLCSGERCVPVALRDGHVDVRAFADQSARALVHDAESGLWALGPESGGHALASANLPELELPTVDGKPFRVSSLRGTKVLLVAWASW